MGFKLIEKRSYSVARGFYEAVVSDDGNGRFYVENGVTFHTLAPVDEMSLSSQLKAGADLKRVPTNFLKAGIEKIQEFSDSYENLNSDSSSVSVNTNTNNKE